MDIMFKIIILVAIALPLTVFSASNSSSDIALPPCRSWDIFVFVQEWPPTICTEGKCKKIPSIVNGWTIHGLWSNRKDNTCDVQFCNNSWKFDWDKIKMLKPELESRWACLLARDRQETRFWKQEWKKHGTCATSVRETGNEYLYFKKGLNLNSRFNITQAFERMKIVPSCKTPINACTIQKAIKTHFKLPSYPPIRSFKVNGRHLIKSIDICMKKDFTLDSCRTKATKCLSDVSMYMYPFHTKCT